MPDNILLPHVAAACIFWLWFVLRYFIVGRKIIGSGGGDTTSDEKVSERSERALRKTSIPYSR
jgi:hypothetical protein